MCADEIIPSTFTTQIIASRLEFLSQDSDSGQDISLAQHLIGPDEDPVEINNEILNHADPDLLVENLHERNVLRIPFQLHEDYEGLFENTWMSRRSERPVAAPDSAPSADAKGLIYQWCSMCLEDPAEDADVYMPDNLWLLEEIMEMHIPARLGLNDWIAKIMFQVAVENMIDQGMEEMDVEDLHEWSPAMEGVFHFPDGAGGEARARCIPIFGQNRAGRLVWTPKHGVRLPIGQRGEQEDRIKILQAGVVVRRIEKALVALARRIARCIAITVFQLWVAPESERQRRAIWTRQQLGQAVREFLGDEWFELPFDVDGKLRAWSEDDVLRPDEEMGDGHVFIGDLVDGEDEEIEEAPEDET